MGLLLKAHFVDAGISREATEFGSILYHTSVFFLVAVSDLMKLNEATFRQAVFFVAIDVLNRGLSQSELKTHYCFFLTAQTSHDILGRIVFSILRSLGNLVVTINE